MGIGHSVQLCGQPIAAAPEGLRPVFLRAPQAARMVVESTDSVCKVPSAYPAASIHSHTPEAVQRWERV